MASKNDEGHTVEEMVTEKSGQTGEKIELAYYARIEAPLLRRLRALQQEARHDPRFQQGGSRRGRPHRCHAATAMAPVSISEADCPAEIVEHERKIAVEAMKQDPKNAQQARGYPREDRRG